MKYFLLFSFFLLTFLNPTIYAQQEQQLIPYRKAKMWGYSNMAGDIVIPIVYSSAGPFINGIAKVSKGHKYGVINKKNDILIPFKYENHMEQECATLSKKEIEYLKKESVGIEYVNHFFSKVYIAAYGKEQIVRLLDSKGQFISDEVYDAHSLISDRQFKRKKAKYPDLHIASKGKKLGLLNTKGKELSAFDYDKLFFTKNSIFIAKKDTLFGLIDTLGNEITSFEYSDIAIYFDLPLDCFLVTRQDGLQAVIDKEGKVVFPFKYNNFSRFYKNYACTNIGGKYVLVDSVGNIIPGIESESPIAMYKDYLMLVKKGKYGLINWQGEDLVPFIYNKITPLNDELLKVKKDSKYGLINASHQIVIPIIYTNIDVLEEAQLIQAKLSQKVGLMTFSGEILFPIEYDEINYSDNKISLVKGNQCAYYFPKPANTTAFKYQYLSSSVHPSKFYLVTTNINPSNNKEYQATDLRHGVLDSVGTEIIPTIYDNLNISNIHKGVIIAHSTEQRKFGLLNAKNDSILPFQFKHLIFSEEDIILAHEHASKRRSSYYDYSGNQLFGTYFDQARQFSEGLAAVMQDGKWGFINSKGNYIVPSKYYLVRPFKDGLAMVFIDKEQWGYIDKNGKEYFEN